MSDKDKKLRMQETATYNITLTVTKGVVAWTLVRPNGLNASAMRPDLDEALKDVRKQIAEFEDMYQVPMSGRVNGRIPE